MFTIALPWLFLFIPLPFLIRFILPAAKQQQHALKVPFYAILVAMSADIKQSYFSSHFKKALAFIIWCLLVFAATAPQWLGDPITLPQQGRDIMLAVDISGSMQLPDMTINGQEAPRLDAVKHVANEFIEKRQGDRLGLILFGTRAYLQTPLTFDIKTVANMLNDASIGLAGMQTAIGDAIGLGVKRLLDTPKQSRVLILLTDGGNNSGSVDPIDAAKLAAENDVRIYTIGFGADQLAIPGIFGSQMVNPSLDLDEETLGQIAKITNAQYFRAKDTDTLKQVYSLIHDLEPVNHEAQLFRPTNPLYPYPLALALLLSVLLALHLLWKNSVLQVAKPTESMEST